MVLVVMLLPLVVVVAEEMVVDLANVLIVNRAVGADVILLRVAEVDALHDLGIDRAMRGLRDSPRP